MFADKPSEPYQTPRHVAIIMDGNGRWASRRGLPRTAGHHKGIEAVRSTIRAAHDSGVEYLTLFGFSSENWRRPEKEIQELMRLLRVYLRAETAELHRNNIKLTVIGDRSRFEKDIVDLIESAESLTASNTDLNLIIALNYGGRHDIVQAAARMARQMMQEGLPADEQTVSELLPGFLMTRNIPDPDLIIRTSGEQRLSNFLLWQCAYSELVFVDTFWPDFDRKDFDRAIAEYNLRDRRFGAMKSL